MRDFIAYWGGFIFGVSVIISTTFLFALLGIRPLVERYYNKKDRKETEKFNMQAEDFFDVYE